MARIRRGKRLLNKPGKKTKLVGPSRFFKPGDQNAAQEVSISTYGLNGSGQDLEEIGAPIPILFGNRTSKSGGFAHTPSMIYQRMHSEGTYQWIRAGYVVGEGLMGEPPERGIRNGTDMIHSFNKYFYDIAFSNGGDDDEDPKDSNTNNYGSFLGLSSTLTSGGKYFTIQKPNKGANSQRRGFSQSFSPDKTFGLQGEPPDCASTIDPDFEGQLPYPTEPQFVQFNAVEAQVTNTIKSDTTELGFAVDLPQPAPIAEEAEGQVPVGSQWRWSGAGLGKPLIIELCPGGRYDSITKVPLIIGQAKFQETVVDQTDKIQIISTDTAFFALYRQYYDAFPVEALSKAYSIFQASYGSDDKVLFIKLREKGKPSPIYSISKRDFLEVEEGGTGLGPNWYRVDGKLSAATWNNFGPCEVAGVNSEMLSDPRVPKMFCRVYYREIGNQNDTWRKLTDRLVCFINPNPATIYADLRVVHPRKEAYEFKIKPLLPVQVSDQAATKYKKCKYGVDLGDNDDASKAFVLYPDSQQEFAVGVKDGFTVVFQGFYEPVATDVELDDQTTEMGVNISYVNEGIDEEIDYPFMSTTILTLRAGQGVSSLSQLSIYYEEGVRIENTDLTIGPSNKFPDLCYYLLTYYPSTKTLTGNRLAGPVKRSQIDTQSFLDAISYTKSKSLFYDGVVRDRGGIHEFISENAKFFLLRFGFRDGKYALFPALQDSATKDEAAAPKQTVTGDIIDANSFRVEYAPLIERDDAFVSVIWRRQERYMLGVNETVTVSPRGYEGPNRLTYDLSGFCTSEGHALAVARFMLAMRIKQNRTVGFTCAKSDVDLTPGRLFKFDFSVSTSSGKTYANQDQYQVTSTTYREDGLLDVRAVYMPAGMSSAVFSSATYPKVS